MPKYPSLPIFYTDSALENAVSIKNYLIENFSDKEVDYFFASFRYF